MTTIRADRGQLNGTCNRISCQAPKAVWRHVRNDTYYCTRCAETINKFNIDYAIIDGTIVCERVSDTKLDYVRLAALSAEIAASVAKLQDECKHPDTDKEPGSNELDSGSTKYWHDCTCNDCGKRWREEQ